MCVNVCVCVSVCVGVGLSHLSFHYALRFLPVIVCVNVCAQCMVVGLHYKAGSAA